MGPGAHHGTVRGLRANGPQWRIARRTKSRSTSPDHAVCGGLAIALLRNGFGLRRMSVQMAEVVISRQMFADVLSLIARLRAPPPVSAQRTDSFRHAGQPAEHLPYVCLNLDGKIITAGDGEEPARHAPGRRCPSSPAVPVSARSGSNANRFNQGTGGGNRVSGSSPTLFSARVMSSCTVSKFKSAVFSMMAETMARLPCRKLGFAADDRRVAAGADTRAQRALFHYRQNGTERAKEQHRIWGEHPRHCSLGKAWHWGPNRVNPTRRGSTRCQSP